MTQAETQVDDELLNDEPEVVEEEVETPEVETETPETTEDETDEIEVHIEGESPPPEEDEQTAPQWVRDVRKDNREKAKRIRELEAKLATNVAPTQVAAVGAKPTLAACDYDEDRFDSELTQWHERKRNADAEAQKKQDEATNAQKAWQTKLDDYGKQKSSLKVRDFEDAEAQAQEVLSVTQQGIILSGSSSPARIVYALGKNPKKAQELASITDPVKFAVAIGNLEMKLKDTPRKAAPMPENVVRGSGRGVSDQTLARLEAEAEKSGDRSKIAAYRAQVKKKANT